MDLTAQTHPWCNIDLEVYESHMTNENVGQIPVLHQITSEQLSTYPAKRIAILGVAGGNGLDLIDPQSVEAVYGYDINAEYLKVCEARYSSQLGLKLQLLERKIDDDLQIDPVDLLIANLLIEYVGVGEFGRFITCNSKNLDVVSCVTQRNGKVAFASASPHASSFEWLSSLACSVEDQTLDQAMVTAGFSPVSKVEYPLPNGKKLMRQDYRKV